MLCTERNWMLRIAQSTRHPVVVLTLLIQTYNLAYRSYMICLNAAKRVDLAEAAGGAIP